jgi:predicted Rossmann fold nucleotide-binding protein DprA/Smf involved in DNA uptake
MSRHSDTSLATLLLVSRAVPSETEPLSAREFWKLVGRIDDPGRLLGETELWAGLVGDEAAARIAPLIGRSRSFAFAIEELEHGGIHTLSAFDDGYPPRWRERLGAVAPPVVHAAGPVDLLAQGGLAIVGSRDVDRAGAEVARAAAAAAVEHGRVVISGGARGSDRLAMQAALDQDGRVVGVLADSLVKTAGDPTVRRAIADDRLCLVTPYGPSAPFSAGNAMGRNKLVYALADTTFVVACETGKGGTWAGAIEALGKGYGPVAVWVGDGAGSGNSALADRGAVPITSVDELFGAGLTRAGSGVDSPTEQLELGM